MILKIYKTLKIGDRCYVLGTSSDPKNNLWRCENNIFCILCVMDSKDHVTGEKQDRVVTPNHMIENDPLLVSEYGLIPVTV